MDDLIHQLSGHPLFSGGLALMAVGAAIGWLRKIPGLALSLARNRAAITIEFGDRDASFRLAQQWLAARKEFDRARSLTATVHYKAEQGGGLGPCKTKEIVRLAPGPGVQFSRFRGLPMIVTRTRERGQDSPGGVKTWDETIKFCIIGGDRSIADALATEIQEATRERPDGIVLYAPNGGWQESSVLARRSPRSLSLADNLFEDILADIRSFLESGAWYADRGIPYRRSFLLHGPPGTGKTTLAPVLADELGLSVSIMSLGDPSLSDAALASLFRSIVSGTILVIEDIDCVFRERTAATDKIGVTLSGLLNVLDGIGSKEGRILFMTTNHPERLDPALVRPGRVDRKIELGYATPDQARQMFAWFFKGHTVGDETIARLACVFADRLGPETTPATIQEHLLRHRDDPTGAARTFGGEPIAVPASVAGRMNGHLAHV